MKSKKFKMFFMVLLACLVIPSAASANDVVFGVEDPQYAGDGSWTQVGTPSYVTLYTDGTDAFSKTYFSTGGDFRVCMSGVDRSTNTYRIVLYEDDSTQANAVASGFVTGNSCGIFRNLNAQVDGTNGKAEFYVKFDAADYYDSSVTVRAYD
ncbi:hypothetical protein ABD68_12515 [Bacillus endophyticus]|uniref:hypothetical protein n=1 Tax=Priestia endophytica TaxID=135735 RepID=UPI0018CC96CF|nr:hypothetical protein [Priestia endophytica]MBG9812385.1 hypothetical protein [Priestia endophytica]